MSDPSRKHRPEREGPGDSAVGVLGRDGASVDREIRAAVEELAEPAAAPELDFVLPRPELDAAEAAHETERRQRSRRQSLRRGLEQVNKELWILLTLLGLAGAINYLLTAQQMMLGLYTLPTLFSAYHFGRRHAVLTAFASAFLVGLMAHLNPQLFAETPSSLAVSAEFLQLVSWGGILVLTAYTMGTLHEKHAARIVELRETYQGLLLILRQFIAKDKFTENHCYRVSVYAAKIATLMGLNNDRIEDLRAAALLHDIGKLELSRDLLYKASKLTVGEYEELKTHLDRGVDLLRPVGGSLQRVIPIILAHHDRFDGSGYRPTKETEIPLEARIIAVADVYDSLTSDRPYRKAMSPFEAKAIIEKGAGSDFDPTVVAAFRSALQRGLMEVPDVVV